MKKKHGRNRFRMLHTVTHLSERRKAHINADLVNLLENIDSAAVNDAFCEWPSTDTRAIFLFSTQSHVITLENSRVYLQKGLGLGCVISPFRN